MNKANLVLVLAALLLFACGRSETPAQVAPPTPTKAPTDTEIPDTTQTTALETLDTIPGLSPTEVTASLGENGFSCEEGGEVEYGLEKFIKRECKKFEPPGYTSYTVGIYGRDAITVKFIVTVILQSGDSEPSYEVALPLIELMAAIPYDGGTPAKAQAWAESVLPALNADAPHNEETVFAGVKYRIYGYPSAIFFEIGQREP